MSAPNMGFEMADLLADVVCALTPNIAFTKLCDANTGYLVSVPVSSITGEKLELRTFDAVMQFVRERHA